MFQKYRASGSLWLLLVLFNSGFIQAAVYVVRPMITYRSVELGADSALVGAVGATFALAPLLFAIPIGRWVDRGRAGFALFAGAGISLLTAFSLLFINSIPLLMLAMPMLGIGHLLTMVGGQTMIANRSQDAKLEKTFAPYQGQSIDVLAKDPKAIALGRSIFGNTCSTCHGSAATGAIGYPNLTDKVWHWGGAPEQVLESVLNGREGVMPEWGKVLTGMGGENAVDYVIAYVRTLSGQGSMENDFMAARGKTLYDGVCVACHGVEGKGNQAMGAPDLTDDYWMYGDSKESLRQTISAGRHGIMPAHRELLGETRSRLVAAYVWSLSNTASGSANPQSGKSAQ